MKPPYQSQIGIIAKLLNNKQNTVGGIKVNGEQAAKELNDINKVITSAIDKFKKEDSLEMKQAIKFF